MELGEAHAGDSRLPPFAYFIRRSPEPLGERPPEVTVKSDTITIRDTIYVPTPRLESTKSLGFTPVTLPIWIPPTDDKPSSHRPESDELTAKVDEDAEQSLSIVRPSAFR